MLSKSKALISRKSSFFSQEKVIAQRNSSIQGVRARADLSDYEILEILGTGGFGIVKKAIHKPTGQIVAVKICDLTLLGTSFDAIERQAQMQRSILHANIAQIYEIVNHDEKAYIFMEYCRNGELFERINREGELSQKQGARIFHQILSALIYLRAAGMSHRDIKPENILFDENWNAKLIDFGFTCEGEAKFRSTVCGTPSYSPPEIVRKQTYDPQLVDVWSLGATLYTMLAAQLPFQGATFEQRKKNILAYRYKQQPNFSAKLQKLFSSIFVDAKYRPKLEDLMNSQFLLSYEMATCSDYIDFKTENPELQSKVIDHIQRSLKIQRQIIEESVRSCRLDRYRAIYYLTLKNKKQLTPFRKRKSSLMKLEPISQTPSLLKQKQSFDYNQFLSLKTAGVKKTQMPRIKVPTIFNQAKIRNRGHPQSPRRILDCLAAYKPL